jgi:hypothetical protein
MRIGLSDIPAVSPRAVLRSTTDGTEQDDLWVRARLAGTVKVILWRVAVTATLGRVLRIRAEFAIVQCCQQKSRVSSELKARLLINLGFRQSLVG